MGNLTRDPEFKTMPSSGTSLATMRLAMNRTYSTSDGTKKDETTYIDVDVWGKQAETIKNYMKKGRPILVEGRLKLDEWQDKETGKNRSQIRVVCESFHFVDSKKGNGETSEPSEPSDEQQNLDFETSNDKLFNKDSDIASALTQFRKKQEAQKNNK